MNTINKLNLLFITSMALLWTSTSYACNAITTVPKTINTPGTYCLTGDLTYTGTDPVIKISGDDITLDLRGYSIWTDQDSNSGIKIENTSKGNVHVKNGVISGYTYGIFINSNPGSTATQARPFVIENMIIDSSFTGIYTTRATGVLIQNNSITSGQTGVVLESYSRDVSIKNNKILAQRGIYSNATYKVTIRNNDLDLNDTSTSSTDNYGIKMSGSSANHIIDNNTLAGYTRDGIIIEQYIGAVVIRDNTIVASGTPYTISNTGTVDGGGNVPAM